MEAHWRQRWLRCWVLLLWSLWCTWEDQSKLAWWSSSKVLSCDFQYFHGSSWGWRGGGWCKEETDTIRDRNKNTVIPICVTSSLLNSQPHWFPLSTRRSLKLMLHLKPAKAQMHGQLLCINFTRLIDVPDFLLQPQSLLYVINQSCFCT